MSTEVEHAHAFRRDMTGLCDCGMTAGQYERLRADETVGRPHAAMTTTPIDQYGKAVDEPLKSGIPTEITRAIIIAWPRQLAWGRIVSDRVAFSDAETGKPILSAVELRVHAWVGHTVVAELVTLADADGNPILDGDIGKQVAVDEDGSFATATTWWHVAEIRVGE